MIKHGTDGEHWEVPVIFDGAHFDDPDTVKYHSARVEIAHLQRWVNETGLTLDISGDEDGVTIGYKRIAHPVVSTDSGTLTLGVELSAIGDSFVSWGLEQMYGFDLTFSPPGRDLDQVLAYATHLQHLVALGLNIPVCLGPLKLVPVHNAGEAAKEVTVYHRGMTTGPAKTDQAEVVPEFVRFCYDDISGLPGVARWLAMSSSLSAVTTQLLDSGEWFLNVVRAAETFEQIEQKNPNGDLKRALRALVSDLAHIIAASRGRPEDTDKYFRKWVDAVVYARNGVVHPRPDAPPDASAMRDLAHSTERLVVLGLLKASGVDDAQLLAIHEAADYAFPADYRLEGDGGGCTRRQ